MNYEYPPIGGGAAPVAKSAAEALASRGHKITVVTMGYRGLPSHESGEGIDIYRLPCWRTKAAVCHPWEQLTYIVSAKRFLRKLLKTENFDVCHTHFIIPTGAIALWLKQYTGIPYVITSHGSDVPGHNRRFKQLHKLLRLPWKKICREASSIIAPSAYLNDLILKSDPTVHCEIVPNGIDIGAYKNGPKENIILVMSRLQPHKGIQRLLSAFARIPHEGWTVHIAGDGPYRNELESLTQKLGLADSVVFDGWLKNKSEEHIGLLAKAKIFVLASDFENSPVSVAEALVSDCHVILSDISAHRYFERCGARFFSTDDINALAVQLKQAMTAPTTAVPENVLSIEHMTNSLEQILLSASNSISNMKG